MPSEFIDKARTIGVSLKRGSARKKSVINEDDGTRAGYHVEHWDDHQDAVAQPKPIELELAVNKEE